MSDPRADAAIAAGRRSAVSAITIRLPWAAAIRAGAKTVENRGRPVANRHIGQPVAIHAAAAWSTTGAGDMRIRNWWWRADSHHRPPLDAADFAPMFRKVLAVATLAGCHPAVYGGTPGRTCCEPWGDWTYNNGLCWHLVLADVVALPEPVGPVKGHLSVPWTLPVEVAEQVVAQLAGASP